MRQRSALWITLVVVAVGALHGARGSTAEASSASDSWEWIVAGGDCQCADGSEFGFWVRQASPEKVMLYLEDGGACFSAETCDPDSGLYQTDTGRGPTAEQGIFDLVDDRNPFGEYSMVYVPYCTGDVHLGTTDNEYAPGVTVHHRGVANDTAALDHLADSFPDATDIVVVGESAGSIAAPLYGGIVADRYPDARIAVLADGSGSYPDLPEINGLLEAWGAADAIPAWPERTDGGAALSIPGLFVLSGHAHPDITFARLDYAYDEEQASRLAGLDVPVGDLRERIAANEAQIEQAGVNIATYLAPGDQHTMLSENEFYSNAVDGQRLVDWVAGLIAGEAVEDVRCTDCERS
jgi:pectinacetylesterase